MIRLLLTLCMCLLAVMLIWGDGPGRQTETRPRESVPVAREIPALQTAAYTPVEASSSLPLVLPLVSAPETALPSTPLAAAPVDLRYITANSVNVREGPSTEFPVVGKLTRGEATRLLWIEDNGWARIILEGDGMTGFVSGDFLSANAP